jgi:choline dehydrogenase-like flavoprotein
VVHDDRLPENLFVADATLFPRSLGNPPILTIIALAKRVARICTGKDAAAGRAVVGCWPRAGLPQL